MTSQSTADLSAKIDALKLSVPLLQADVKQPAVRISATILDRIGQSPLVRLNKIGIEEGVECELCM
jgi:hypothetical protein